MEPERARSSGAPEREGILRPGDSETAWSSANISAIRRHRQGASSAGWRARTSGAICVCGRASAIAGVEVLVKVIPVDLR